MKYIIFFFSILFFSCSSLSDKKMIERKTLETNTINHLLNDWHKAASDANFKNYFDLLSSESIFIGTDATEIWNKEQFMSYAKPYFDKGNAWSFKTLQRNLYFSNDFRTAWFDEVLDTSMKLCRGSGVLVRENNSWKIKHYVLSIAIPNDNTEEIVRIKSEIDNTLIKIFSKNK